MPDLRTCRNCAFSTWEMTTHKPPRINPNYVGRCNYKAIMPMIPAAIMLHDANSVLAILRPERRGYAIDPKDPHTNCPCWKAKESGK